MFFRRSRLLGLLAAACVSVSALAQSEIRIAHVLSLTGPLEAYGKQTSNGFYMGLDYATQGSMTVAGKKLVVIEKDDQGKPCLLYTSCMKNTCRPTPPTSPLARNA